MQLNYQICTKTVLDSTYPGIVFDSNGISNHYWDFQNVVKPNWHPNDFGQKSLDKIVDLIKAEGRGKEFDCIMGLSGGADSSYMLHIMVTQYKLRPLVFHVDGGWNSEVAVNNINNLVESLGVDIYTEVINWNEMRDFQLSMFKSGVPHLDTPQDLAFTGVLNKFSEKYGIKYILNGGNISTECVLRPLDIIYWAADMRQNRDILSRYGEIPIVNYPFTSIYYHKLYRRYIKGAKILKPLNYMPYIKQQAMDELKAIYDWKPYPQKHFESRFTRFFEGYWLPTRFGFDMRRVDLSSLILTGQMTRNEALFILKKPAIDAETTTQEFSFIATKLGISSDELLIYLNMPKKYYWNYRNQQKLFKVGELVLKFFSGVRRGGSY